METTVVYNYGQKKNYSQDSKSITQQASLSENSQLAAEASKELYKESGFTQQASIIEDARSLDQVLSVERAQKMGQMVIARGQSGKPAVISGHTVKLDNMGRLNGTYWVTGVKHVLDVQLSRRPVDPTKEGAEDREEADEALTPVKQRVVRLRADTLLCSLDHEIVLADLTEEEAEDGDD